MSATVIYQRPVGDNLAVAVVDAPGIERTVRIYEGGTREVLALSVAGAALLGEAATIAADVAKQVPPLPQAAPEPITEPDPEPVETLTAPDDTKEPTA